MPPSRKSARSWTRGPLLHSGINEDRRTSPVLVGHWSRKAETDHAPSGFRSAGSDTAWAEAHDTSAYENPSGCGDHLATGRDLRTIGASIQRVDYDTFRSSSGPNPSVSANTWTFMAIKTGKPMRAANKTKKRRKTAARGKKKDPIFVDGKRPRPMYVDYKDVELLKKLINRHGRIVGRRKTGCTAASQHAVTAAVKRARFMALLPYVGE